MLISYGEHLAWLTGKILSKIETKNIKDSVFESIMVKSMRSEKRSIKEYLSNVINKMSIHRFGDIACEDISAEAERINMELEIKSFFFLQGLGEKEGMHVEVDDFMFRFKTKF